MVSILETLADYASVSKDIGYLIEKCRQGLSRQICLQFADENKTLRVLTIQPELEQKLIDSRLETAGGVIAALEPSEQRLWIETLSNAVKEVQERGDFPVILCSEAARPLVKSSSSREIPDLVVLSVPEIAPDMKIEAICRLGSSRFIAICSDEGDVSEGREQRQSVLTILDFRGIAPERK